MAGQIDSIAGLEAVIGRTPPGIALKVIDHLDETARHWIATSPLMFAGFGDAGHIAITPAGGAAGFAGADRATLRVPLAMIDRPELARAGLGFGSLFLAPGVGETLRVNGRVAAVADGAAAIAVEECYVHCAKALIRSAFWTSDPVAEVPDTPAAFVAASRFMALATIGADGGADLSPKGDPAGSMARLDEDGDLWFADRPGNRRTDSFRNIISQPAIAGVLLIPGAHRVAIVGGAAMLTTDDAARAAFAVQGKSPLLAIRTPQASVTLHDSAALARARLWPLTVAAEGIDPAKMFVAHMKLNRDKGLGAKLASAMVSVPGVLQRGLDHDYKNNLY